MQCFENNPIEHNRLFEKGVELINQKIINATFQQYFYTIAQEVFKKISKLTSWLLFRKKS
ncbi:hypothetical protein H9X57_12020 [Flavobacterium piscinae]|nr:hypothetical protein [Flavobacterium piscinae]